MVIADRQLRKTTQRAVLADCDQHDSTVFGHCKLLNLQLVSLRATFRPKSVAQPDPFRFIRRKCCSYRRHGSQTIQVSISKLNGSTLPFGTQIGDSLCEWRMRGKIISL